MWPYIQRNMEIKANTIQVFLQILLLIIQNMQNLANCSKLCLGQF